MGSGFNKEYPTIPVIKTAVRAVSLNNIIKKEKSQEELENSFSQWSTYDGLIFAPCHKTVKKLSPDLYDIVDFGSGPVFKKCDFNTEDIIRFDDSIIDTVVSDIQKFWEKEDDFRRFGISFSRGTLIFGSAGSGKTCTIKLIIDDIIKRNGIAVRFSDQFINGMEAFRKIEPNTPVVCIMEDLDSIMEHFHKSAILNLLDGVNKIDKVVYIATTNYPELLEDRVSNRPSRFDRRYLLGPPNDSVRKQYIEFLSDKMEQKVDIETWIKDTKNMSISHIKELFISVYLLGKEYKSTLKELRDMSKKITSENMNKINRFGFIEDDWK